MVPFDHHHHERSFGYRRSDDLSLPPSPPLMIGHHTLSMLGRVLAGFWPLVMIGTTFRLRERLMFRLFSPPDAEAG